MPSVNDLPVRWWSALWLRPTSSSTAGAHRRCRACRNGQVTCPSCHGRGGTDCYRCSGKGQIVCMVCGGERAI